MRERERESARERERESESESERERGEKIETERETEREREREREVRVYILQVILSVFIHNPLLHGYRGCYFWHVRIHICMSEYAYIYLVSYNGACVHTCIYMYVCIRV